MLAEPVAQAYLQPGGLGMKIMLHEINVSYIIIKIIIKGTVV